MSLPAIALAIPIPAATTTAAAAAAATATAEAAATATARLPLACFVHFQGAAVQIDPIQRLDRSLGFGIAFELSEGESTRTTGVTIGHDVQILDPAPAL